MTSLVPRGPYSDQELQKLYPVKLKLQLVQIVRLQLQKFSSSWLHAGYIDLHPLIVLTPLRNARRLTPNATL